MASWAIIENGNRVLFIKRSKKTSRPGQWCFPGGGIKLNESPEQACIREAKEETGLDVEVCNLVAENGSSSYFLCTLAEPNQEIKLSLDECDNYQWIKPSELLQIGFIMDLKITFKVLTSMGYQIELNKKAEI